MFNIKENIQIFIIVALGTALVLGYFVVSSALETKNSIIAALRKDVAVCQSKSAGLEISNLGLKNIIIESNSKIEALAVDHNKSVALYEKEKNRKPEVRYEVIYKYINRDISKSGECNDIKNVLNSLSSIDYNDL